MNPYNPTLEAWLIFTVALACLCGLIGTLLLVAGL